MESSLFAKSKLQSTEIWAELYPGEPFELDYSCSFSDAEMYSGEEKSITYDLVSAVKRQSVFYYQVTLTFILLLFGFSYITSINYFSMYFLHNFCIYSGGSEM